LVLDLGVLKRNLAMMRQAIARHPGVVLRPHLKTAKSREVAALAAPGFGPITVSTLAEARFFAEGRLARPDLRRRHHAPEARRGRGAQRAGRGGEGHYRRPRRRPRHRGPSRRDRGAG
jgi:hypothetical protein